MSQNEFLSEIFENLDEDYQMLIIPGQCKPVNRPQNAIFSCGNDSYFLTFFIEHPVVYGEDNLLAASVVNNNNNLVRLT